MQEGDAQFCRVQDTEDVTKAEGEGERERERGGESRLLALKSE
jgi:hypothetical protein